MELDFGDGLCLGMAAMYPIVLLWRSACLKAEEKIKEASDGK